MFNIEKFDIKLDTDVIGRNFVYCEEIDSTNSFLINTKEYDKHGTVLLSENQTQGKGRKDRIWLSAADQNLTFSILLKEDFSHETINIINLGTSLAVAQAIENQYQLPCELKWPNDVLVNQKKVAGILLESTSMGSEIEKLVIGIGINVNQPNFTGKFNIPPTSIKKEFKNSADRERLLSEVLNIFEEIFKASQTNPGQILEDWKSRCQMLGEKIRIEDGEVVKFGVFEDIDKNGFMILNSGNKRELIHAGDIILR
ncbi:MAG: biotin--[acetyl-CoA-carboxylase] ligase [Bacteroidetes bacterium]|nr:biotin--[acetyl-CoA-carboxylase] ligase [Bacteroidota bacterium]